MYFQKTGNNCPAGSAWESVIGIWRRIWAAAAEEDSVTVLQGWREGGKRFSTENGNSNILVLLSRPHSVSQTIFQQHFLFKATKAIIQKQQVVERTLTT